MTGTVLPQNAVATIFDRWTIATVVSPVAAQSCDNAGTAYFSSVGKVLQNPERITVIDGTDRAAALCCSGMNPRLAL